MYIYNGNQKHFSINTGQTVYRIPRGHPFYLPLNIDPNKLLEKGVIPYNINNYDVLEAEKNVTDKFIINIIMPKSVRNAIMAIPATKLYVDLHPTATINIVCNANVRQVLDIPNVKYVETVTDKGDRDIDLNLARFNTTEQIISATILLYFKIFSLPFVKEYLRPKCSIEHNPSIDIGIELGVVNNLYNFDKTSDFSIGNELIKKLKYNNKIIVFGKMLSQNKNLYVNEKLFENIIKCRTILSLGDLDSAYIAGVLGIPCIVALPRDRIYYKQSQMMSEKNPNYNNIPQRPLRPKEQSLMYFDSIKYLFNPTIDEIINSLSDIGFLRPNKNKQIEDVDNQDKDDNSVNTYKLNKYKLNKKDKKHVIEKTDE